MSGKPSTQSAPAPTDQPKQNLPAITGPRLPFHPVFESQFGINKISYTALVNAIFPNAQSADSIFLALSYCKSRNLDPFKRNVHIVPIWDSKKRQMVDTIWPGIGELRTTAFRTREYAGRGDTQFGPDITQMVGKIEITYPEWAQVKLFRLIQGNRVEFWGPRVYWIETYAVTSRDDDSPNTMWRDRPRGQLEKCAEAAALRAAFPEELGGDLCSDEVGNRGKVLDVSAVPVAQKPGIESVTEMITGGNPVGEGQQHNEDGVIEGEVVNEEADEPGNAPNNADQDAAGNAIRQLKQEIARCKRKGELEALIDELDQSPDWQTIRDLGLLEEAKKDVNQAIVRMGAK